MAADQFSTVSSCPGCFFIKGEEEAFGLVRIFLHKSLGDSVNQYVSRFFLRFGGEITSDIFSIFHVHACEEYLDFTFRILSKGQEGIAREFMSQCVANSLSPEEATQIFAKLMVLLDENGPDVEGCKILLENIAWNKPSGESTTLH